MQLTDQQISANYETFISKLTFLTRIYGVAIQSVGGVSVARQVGEFENVRYRADLTSGDLYPEFPEGRL